MSDGRTPSNGDPVRFREFDDYRRLSAEDRADMKKDIKRNDGRLDDLEGWRNRVAGPVAFLLAALAIGALSSNILVVWLR